MTHQHSVDSAHSEEFAVLYARHASPLLRHCARKLQDEQHAEDIVQETFLRAWLYVCSGRAIESPTTFLRKIADNLIIDEARRAKGHIGLSLDVLQEKGFDLGYDSVDHWQKSLEVYAILDGLRKKEGKLLSMRYLEGMHPSDIAQRIGIAPNTVAARLHRIVKRLTIRLRTHREQSVGTDR
jgi:RNA polymerase sigma-70 factor, ECF subfamily